MSDKLNSPELPQPSKQRSRWLEAGLTILVAQLLAAVLLTASLSVPVALGVAVAVTFLFFGRRLIWRSSLWTLAQTRRIAKEVAMRALDRRTYRFGMRSLLLAMLIVAVLSAWFGYRYRAVNLERRLLHGKWVRFNRDDKPMIMPDGTPYTFDFSESSYTIDPLSEPKRIEFHTARGTSHAVYRWEGRDLVITQVSAGGGRPVAVGQIDIEPGTARGREVSIATFRLRRLND
jgi:hypothetical protein